MGTFSGGVMYDPTTGRPVIKQPIKVLSYPAEAPIAPDDGPIATGIRGGYGIFTAAGADVVTLEAGGVAQVLVSIEKQLEAGSSTAVNGKTPVDGAITLTAADVGAAPATILVPGKNLYNPADPAVAPGYYVSHTTGGLLANTSHTATGFIPVTAGTTYTISNPSFVAWYGPTKAFVSGQANSGSLPLTVTAPAGAAYLRTSLLHASFGANFQVEKGATKTTYEAYSATNLAPVVRAPLLTEAAAYTDSKVAALPTPPRISPTRGLERLRALRAFGSGRVNVAVVSDSTGNDATDWVRLWALKWGGTLPTAVRRTYRAWTGTAWATETVDAAGTTPPPGVYLNDTFTRTGDVRGSTPDSGSVWTGEAAKWTADGTHATLTAAAGASGSIIADMRTRDTTSTFTLDVTTTAPPVSQLLRILTGSGGTANVRLDLTLSTTGVLSARPWKSTSGGVVALAVDKNIDGVTANSGTPQQVVVTVKVEVQNITVTVVAGGQTTTLTGTVTEADYAGLGTYVGVIGYQPTAGTFGFKMDRVESTTPAPTPFGTLAVHNGAMAGATLTTFDAAKRTQMFSGIPMDVLFLAMGHNHASESPETFTAQVKAWVAAWEVEHSKCSVVIVSQNPQVPPASGITTHRDRQVGLRLWAKDVGFDYVPAFEAFVARPDGGTALVSTDGVHPTMPPAGTLTGEYGAVVWADTFTAAL